MGTVVVELLPTTTTLALPAVSRAGRQAFRRSVTPK